MLRRSRHHHEALPLDERGIVEGIITKSEACEVQWERYSPLLIQAWSEHGRCFSVMRGSSRVCLYEGNAVIAKVRADADQIARLRAIADVHHAQAKQERKSERRAARYVLREALKESTGPRPQSKPQVSLRMQRRIEREGAAARLLDDLRKGGQQR